MTVAWNIPNIKLPKEEPNSFPKLDDITNDFVCKRGYRRVGGEKGYFYGSFSKQSGQPEGYGVFVCGDWVHCGKVLDGLFTDGRRVSVSQRLRVLKLVNTKSLPEGSVLQKIERYSKHGLELSFNKNG